METIEIKEITEDTYILIDGSNIVFAPVQKVTNLEVYDSKYTALSGYRVAGECEFDEDLIFFSDIALLKAKPADAGVSEQ